MPLRGVVSLLSMELSWRSSSAIFPLSSADWFGVGLGLRLAAGGPRIFAPADTRITLSADDSLSTLTLSRDSCKVFSESGAVMPTSGDSALGVTGEGSHGVRAGEWECSGRLRAPDMRGRDCSMSVRMILGGGEISCGGNFESGCNGGALDDDVVRDVEGLSVAKSFCMIKLESDEHGFSQP